MLAACSAAQWCPTLWSPVGCSPPGSSVHGLSQQEYWSGLAFPTPGGLAVLGVETASLKSPALAGRLFTTEPPSASCLLNA